MRRLLNSTEFFTIVLPIVVSVFVGMLYRDWTLIPLFALVMSMGWFTNDLWRRRNGLVLMQVVGECRVTGCTYTCSAGNPPTVAHMMEAHLREVHEILPGLTP